jgi:arylsulfatase A-like enzyme
MRRIAGRDRYKTDDYRSRELDYIEAVYDEELAYTDHWIGKLVEGLKSLDRGATVIALTGDHGEYFLDRPPKRRFFHSQDLHEALIRVPLVVGGDIASGHRGRRYPHTVETRSIPKTLMHLAGIDDHPFEGEDLFALMDSGEDPRQRTQYSEGSNSSGWQLYRSVISYPWKLIVALSTEGYELFNLERDPNETRNLWDEADPELERIRSEMRAKIAERALDSAELPPPETFELSEGEIKGLRALGYAP